MLVPCVVKEAVSKFDAGRDGEREREKKKEKELINSVGSMKVEGSLTYKLEGGKCVGQ